MFHLIYQKSHLFTSQLTVLQPMLLFYKSECVLPSTSGIFAFHLFLSVWKSIRRLLKLAWCLLSITMNIESASIFVKATLLFCTAAFSNAIVLTLHYYAAVCNLQKWLQTWCSVWWSHTSNELICIEIIVNLSQRGTIMVSKMWLIVKHTLI